MAKSTRSQGTTSSSVRSFFKTKHSRQRQHERGISSALMGETLRDGLVLDEEGSRKLRVSDYVVVISDSGGLHRAEQKRADTVITTFRHKLLNEWRAVSSTDEKGRIALNYSYLFHQHKDACLFVGKTQEGVEFGFGVQILGDSREQSSFDMATLTCCRHSTSLECFPMRLEKILSRQASASHASVALDRDTTLTTMAASQASTRHYGRVKTIPAIVAGQDVHDIPIIRSLIATRPPGRIAQWLEYDKEEDAPDHPYFSMRDLQHALGACTLPLPELSGRWRLDEIGDYPGFSAYTLMAFPLGPPQQDGATRCLILALQSNDEEEGGYERFGVGRGQVGRPSAEPVHLTLAMHRIREGCAFDRPARLEVLRGSCRLLSRSSGATLSRIQLPVAGDCAWELGQSVATSPPSSDPLLLDPSVSYLSTDEASRATAAAADLQRAEKLLACFLPDPLPLDMAVWAGDVERVAALAQSTDWPALSRQSIEAGGTREGRVEPMLAAALHGRADVAELLLGHRPLGQLGHFDLACLGAVLEGATAELLARVERNTSLRTAHCDKADSLSGLGLVGCGLAAAAAACGGGALARALARAGCEFDVFTAVLAGDAEWVAGLKADNPCLHDLDRPFPDWAQMRGLRPLMAAVQRRDLPMAKALLAQGANPFALRVGHKSTAINYAQVYDLNEAEDFPTLRAVLTAAKAWQERHGLPKDWAGGILERCQAWQDATHPKAWAKLVEFELDDFSVDLQDDAELEGPPESADPCLQNFHEASSAAIGSGEAAPADSGRGFTSGSGPPPPRASMTPQSGSLAAREAAGDSEGLLRASAWAISDASGARDSGPASAIGGRGDAMQGSRADGGCFGRRGGNGIPGGGGGFSDWGSRALGQRFAFQARGERCCAAGCHRCDLGVRHEEGRDGRRGDGDARRGRKTAVLGAAAWSKRLLKYVGIFKEKFLLCFRWSWAMS